MQFLKVWPNGGANPRVDGGGEETVDIGKAGSETQNSNVARPAASEHGVYENCKASEQFGLGDVVVVEIEDLEMFPEVAVFARHESHCFHASFGSEERQDVEQQRVW